MDKKLPSTIAKGYMAKSDKEGLYHLGATYERMYESEDLDLEVAKRSAHSTPCTFWHTGYRLDH